MNLLSLFQLKRNPNKDLDALSATLQAALGDHLRSVMVFGSFARGNYRPGRSNVNVLIVAELPYEALLAMRPVLRKWQDKGYGMPVLVEPEDVDDFARDFPIEFLDMSDHHRLLWGDNLIANLKVNLMYLESQIEHDLALMQLQVRQGLIRAGDSPRRIREVLLKSRTSFYVLLTASYRLLGENEARIDKMQATEKMVAHWNLDRSVLAELESLDTREPGSLKTFAVQYLRLMEGALARLREK